ncbi:hypothetical protein GQ53DRAFT_651723 [Thozetella sp. PMI_491]|nr:hypothetical protein GQ53DRAFT_651723 [Thozetella sp. PMI_491]
MSWDPAALLNPKAQTTSPAFAHNSLQTALPNRSLQHSAEAPMQLTFQFNDPSNNFMPDFSGVPYGGATGLPNRTSSMPDFGTARHIERLNNVEPRADVPQPKRRKTQTEGDPVDPQSAFHGQGTGLFGQYMMTAVKTPENNASQQGIVVRQSGTVDLTEDDDDVIMIDNPREAFIDEEVCYGMIEGASINCHRVPAPKPGMVSVHGDAFWPQVKVVLRRRTDDANHKIYVYDCTRKVFGTVDAKVANCLSPLVDSALQVRTDCRIASRRKAPGEVIGGATSRSHPVQLVVYGPRKYANQVGNRLSQHNLRFLNPGRLEPGVKVLNPHAGKVQVPPRPSAPAADANRVYPTAPPVVRTQEEIRSEVLGVFDSLPRSEDLPELEPDPRIRTELLKHQRQALFFMTNREKDGTDGVNPTWKQRSLRNGNKVWFNIVTNQHQPQTPRPTTGGILADMMGLGKTLSILSLIVGALDDSKVWEALPPVQPRPPAPKPSQSRQFDVPRPQPFALTQLKHNGRATLLICPLSTITNWEEQMRQHIQPGAINYHVYHGPNRVKDPHVLAQFDLVITTYGSVSSELSLRSKGKSGKYPLEEVGWFRIVLDEAHMIREQNTLAFKSVCRLQANRRWAVTGTPVQNKLEDLAALLAFLRVSPFDERSKFVQYIIAPFKNADPEIVAKLRVLIDPITIRRLKDKLKLPPRTDELVRLDFSEEEKLIYDKFSRNAEERVKALTGANQDRILGGKTYIHILRSILRLRLICAHGKDLLNEEDLEVLQGLTAETAIELDDDDEDKPSLHEAKAYRHFDLMKETDNDNCIKCGRKLASNEGMDVDTERQEDILGYMTPCFHIYCPSCIKNFCDEANSAAWNSKAVGHCPICRDRVVFSCVELHHDRADTEHEMQSQGQERGLGKATREDRYTGPHTKTKALIQELLALKERSAAMPDEPPLKSVVFSTWTSHLDLIQRALDTNGITYTRLDGKMTRTARAAAMDAFREDPSVHVIIVSITAGGLGLNLTAGNTAFVMEPQYNPAAEAQAVDRIHRLGQKRPVRTVRYIMRGSFEEKMLELQEKKKKLASLSMDGRDKGQVMDRTEAARQRLLDLRSLFK